MSLPVAAQVVPTIQVETHLIDSTFSVRDEQGKIVSDLTQEDFEILEDGVPQTIRYFGNHATLPLSIGLVIDVSGSQEKFVRQHEKDIETFLSHILGSADQAFAVCFGNHLRLVSDFTSAAQQITDGIHRYDKGSHNFTELGPKEDRELGTALYDAVFYSISEKMAPIRHRRKILLLLSDGEENSSEHDLIDSIEAAQNADVLVYAIRYTELRHGTMNARDRYGVRALDHLTAQTGGRAFDARTTQVNEAFAQLAEELRGLYEVAYQSTNTTRDGSYRKITIQTRKLVLHAHSRTGYYAR
jgi:Ca-activated chloride channel homolog